MTTQHTQSQRARIHEYMKQGNAITPLEALDKFGCFRLSERIREIERLGVPIVHGRHITPDGKRVGKYWIEQQLQTN